MADPVDHFAVLGLERSVSLDENLVRERFHELSRDAHPDSDGGDEDAFAAINEAQRVLGSTSARLRHLLELQFDCKPDSTGAMSPQLMDLFSDVGAALSQADAVIAKRRGASSAVAKALLAPQELEVQAALMAASGKLMSRRREIEDGLSAIGLDWREAMLEACHELSFLEKWQRQVQERLGELL